jgi:serine/threonine protein kinase
MRRSHSVAGHLGQYDGGAAAKQRGWGHKRNPDIFARVAVNNPYLGNFHHAPSAGNVGAKYFQTQITPEEEWQKQKNIRHNPLTPTFHVAFTKYADKRFRLNKGNSCDSNDHFSSTSSKEKIIMDVEGSAPKGRLDIWKTWSPKRGKVVDPQLSPIHRPRKATGGSFNGRLESSENDSVKAAVSSNRHRYPQNRCVSFSDANDDWIMQAADIASKRVSSRRKQSQNTKGSIKPTFLSRKEENDSGSDPRLNVSDSEKNAAEIGLEKKRFPEALNGAKGHTPQNPRDVMGQHHIRSKSSPNHLSSCVFAIDTTTLVCRDETLSKYSDEVERRHASDQLKSKNWEYDSANAPFYAESIDIDSEATPRANHKRNFTVNLPPVDSADALHPGRGIYVSPVLRFLEMEKHVHLQMESIEVLMGKSTEEPATNISPEKSTFGKNPSQFLSISTDTKSLPLVQASREKASPKALSIDQLNPWFIHSTAIAEVYEFKQFPLGHGTYSHVYEAQHKTLKNFFAIKSIQKKFLITEQEKESVRHEVEIHLRFRHPHIVKLFEVYEDKDMLHLVMEHATEGTLGECMPRRVPERMACKLIYELLIGVAHLHDAGILHSDLKPDNVLINKAPPLADSVVPYSPLFLSSGENAGRVQICDFGLARKVPNIKYFKDTGDVHKAPFLGLCGTPGYIAPELLRQESYGKPVDLWSVGIILYELLAGYAPFRPPHKCLEDDNVRFSEKTFHGISAEARRLIRDLLVVQPSARATAHQALESDWFKLHGCST